MYATLACLLDRLDRKCLITNDVIPWGAPVPSFGDATISHVATLGLNPSNREFVDEKGKELQGHLRRFHTLNSLGIDHWLDAEASHLELIIESCQEYFYRNPYEGWFRKLDRVLSGTGFSYFDAKAPACHLDLIPYATGRKWSALSSHQRTALLKNASDTLALLLRDSSIKAIVLNGISVVENFQLSMGIVLDRKRMANWTLPRRDSNGVAGFAYRGVLSELVGVQSPRPVLVLGYNHNLQSSFGVTTRVMGAIRDWIATEVGALA